MTGKRIVDWRGPVLFEVPPYIQARKVQPVSLIRHIRLQHRQQASLAVVCDVFEDSGERRTVREVRDFSEVESHFNVPRVRADTQPPIALGHEPFAHVDDRVRAGAARSFYRQRLKLFQSGNLRELCCRPELQLALRHGYFASHGHGRDDRTTEQFICKRIAHHAHIALLANFGDGGSRQIPRALLVPFLPSHGTR